jgi:hypothetical protein
LPASCFFAEAWAERSSSLATFCCANALKPNARLNESNSTFFIFVCFNWLIIGLMFDIWAANIIIFGIAAVEMGFFYTKSQA